MDFLIALLLAGKFLNPVIPGDWPDPALIRVGADYYSVRSTFGWTPGLQIVHSRDLVHWRYIGFGIASHPGIEPGTTRGGVWGSEMGYNPNTGTFLLYAPIGNRIWAMASKSPGGPYSAPVELGLQGIDPGFFADDDGRLYLVWDWGRIVELARDGLSVKGEVCDTRLDRGRDFEGPDIFKRGRWYYCLYSTGGTRPYEKSAVNTARARDLRGPWERDPANPQLQADEYGPAHGTLVETQRGEWYVSYHAYDLAHYTLGRSMWLQPVEWTREGWWRAVGGRVPAVRARRPDLPETRSELAASDEFNGHRLGPQWFFHGPVEHSLAARPGWLRLGPGYLLQRVTEKAFEFTARVEGRGGLHLYHDPARVLRFAPEGKPFLRVRVQDERARFYRSADGRTWQPSGEEVYFGNGGHPDLGWIGFEKRNTWTGATFGVYAEDTAWFDWFRAVK